MNTPLSPNHHHWGCLDFGTTLVQPTNVHDKPKIILHILLSVHLISLGIVRSHDMI